MKAKVRYLSGRALNWAVAKALGLNPNTDPALRRQYVGYDGYAESNGFGCAIKNYSTDWGVAGPIIELEHIQIRPTLNNGKYRTSQSCDAVYASIEVPYNVERWNPESVVFEYGETMLIAAMRCFVTSRLGDEIELPDDLNGEIK